MSFVCYLFLAHHCLPFSFISHQIFFNLSEIWNHKVQHDSTRIIIAVVGTTSHSFSQVTHVNFFSYLLVKFITNKKQQSYDVTLLGGKNFFLHSFISSLMTLSNLALPMSNTANRKSFGSSMVPYYHDPSYSCFRTTKHGVYMSSWHCFLTWPISAISKMVFKMALHWLPSYAGTFRTFWSHLPIYPMISTVSTMHGYHQKELQLHYPSCTSSKTDNVPSWFLIWCFYSCQCTQLAYICTKYCDNKAIDCN